MKSDYLQRIKDLEAINAQHQELVHQLRTDLAVALKEIERLEAGE